MRSRFCQALTRRLMCRARQVLENKPTTTFWGTLARALERHCRDAAKGVLFAFGIPDP